MDRIGFQGCFILGFVLCLAKGELQDTCDGYSHQNDTEFVDGVLGQNITLSCELSLLCKSLWAFRTSPVKYLNAGSCSDCGESFSVIDIIHGDITKTSLHVNNINESLAYIYDCSCQHGNGTDKLKCFHLKIVNASCQLELTLNEKVKVFHNSSGSQHKAIRTVNVNTDDNITARCVSDAAKLNINCKNRSGLLKIKETKDRCRISCEINKVCQTRIILSVISSTTHSPSTSTTKKEVTRSTKLTITRNGTVTFATSQYTTERKRSLPYTMSKEETYLISTSSVKTTSTREQTKVTSPDDGITAIVSTTYTGKKVTLPATMMFVVILAAFIVILVFIILVLLLKILKGKRKRSAEKEEWINPIYEGFEEGRERDGSTEHEISIIARQPDQESLDDGVYHYIVTSNSKPIHES
ncbi:hypothetical protein BSL78_01756 [Apostichopus japonicus]|uniref:Immunoglobulin subtype domain-containing protein n=1 Tax=Stichopus japonicus TaxID=307972 RepID=A0A2G8LM52_STIJA|nr:hypothetical protein BSL78_01756 [Apostichopus japonicus]